MPRKPNRAKNVIDFIEAYCLVPEGEHVGKKLVLLPFQKKFLRDIYNNPHGTQHAYLTVARKNGKTALLAMILLAHIVGPEAKQNTQLVSGARSRSQAALLWSLAAKMIELNPALQEITHIVPSQKKINGLIMNTEYQALSADGSKNMGLSPILAILDEVSQVIGPTDFFTSSIISSQAAHREPLLIAISTQAPSDGDMWSIWLDDAIRSDDPHTIAHIYAADDGCELLDKRQWRKANPALGKFLNKKYLAQQMLRAKRLPTEEASARNLHLNNRISSDSLAFSPESWKSCNGDVDLSVFRDARVCMGLDLSGRVDLTAAVLSTERDGVVYVYPLVFCPTSGIEDRGKRDRAPYKLWVDQGYMIPIGGQSMDYDQIAGAISEFLTTEDIVVAEVHFDKYMISHFQAACGRASTLQESEWHEVAQYFEPMGERLGNTQNLILEKKIRHGSHPLLNYGASNAVAVLGRKGVSTLDKKKSTARIDMIVAMVMACWPFGVGRDHEEPFDVNAMIG